MNRPTILIGLTGFILAAIGISIFAIKGAMTLTAVGFLWVGLMLILFILYARFGEIKKVLAHKGARYGANTVIMVVVFSAVVVFMALLGEAHKKRLDLTKTGRFTLSSQTKKILGSLDVPVKAVAFYRNESGTMHAMQRQTMRDLLEEYANHSDKFSFTFIDPDRKPGLASKYGISEYRVTLLIAGDKQVKVGNEKEEKVTNALIKLLRKHEKIVYFIKGHGEKDITSSKKDGYRAAAAAIVNENYVVKELLLMRVKEVPKNASVVVVASPKREMAKNELDKLDRYYKRGGAMLVEVDPGHPPGFRTWLEQYGFKLQTDVIIDHQSQLYGANYLTPVVYAYHKKHPLTEGFTLASYFPIANSVYIDEDKSRGRYELALTGPNSWTEIDKDQLESGKAEYNEEREKRGPIPIMSVTTFAVKGKEDAEGAKRDRYGKIVLIGDSDFANNTNLNLAGNGDLFLNTINWLAEEADLIAVRAKKSNMSPVVLTAAQGRAIFWIPVVMIPSFVLMAGVAIYSRRRWFR